MSAASSRRTSRGLTLIETMMVIVLIVSLAGIIFPTFVQAKRRAKDAVCISNLRSCFTAAALYAADYDDSWPLGKDCADLLRPDAWPARYEDTIRAMPLLSVQLKSYGAEKRVWACPLDSGIEVFDFQPSLDFAAHPTLFSNCGMSYAYNTSAGLLGLPFTAISEPSETMYLQDQAGHWHPGVAAIPKGVHPNSTVPWTQHFKYHVVFVDGHVKKLSYLAAHNAYDGRK